MPHTSHKKRPKHRSKQQLVDDRGWTHVSYAQDARAAAKHFDSSNRDPVFTQDPSLTLAKLQHAFGQIQQRWNATESCGILRSIIRKRFVRGSEVSRIGQAVCLAIGSMATHHSHSRAFWQLATFMDIVKTLADGLEAEVKMHVQEPALLALDLEFLQSLGFSILKGNEAKQLIGPETFAFVPFLDKAQEKHYVDCAVDCPFYVTVDLGTFEQFFQKFDARDKEESTDLYWSEHVARNVARILDTHEVLVFPSCPEADAALRLTMYISRGDQDDGQEPDGQ